MLHVSVQIYSSPASFLDFHPVLILFVAVDQERLLYTPSGTARKSAQNQVGALWHMASAFDNLCRLREVVGLRIEQSGLERLQSE